MSGGRAPDFALAVYGGAFDPPHPGHESVIRRALLCAERVALVPSHRHAFGKRMGDFELRCRWLARLARRIDPRRVYCEPIEAGLMPDRPAVYSIDLLEALAARSGLASPRIALLIGADNEAGCRASNAPPGVLALRPAGGGGAAAAAQPMIRQRLREGLAVPEAWCLPEVKDELHCYGGERQAG